jgi:hypothetical protein
MPTVYDPFAICNILKSLTHPFNDPSRVYEGTYTREGRQTAPPKPFHQNMNHNGTLQKRLAPVRRGGTWNEACY